MPPSRNPSSPKSPLSLEAGIILDQEVVSYSTREIVNKIGVLRPADQLNMDLPSALQRRINDHQIFFAVARKNETKDSSTDPRRFLDETVEILLENPRMETQKAVKKALGTIRAHPLDLTWVTGRTDGRRVFFASSGSNQSNSESGMVWVLAKAQIAIPLITSWTDIEVPYSPGELYVCNGTPMPREKLEALTRQIFRGRHQTQKALNALREIGQSYWDLSEAPVSAFVYKQRPLPDYFKLQQV